jgi:ABC-2 type transport system permease protein
MNKIRLIISREYFTRVRKKSFFLTTILVPLVMIGFYAAILYISLGESADQQKIAILDEAHIFNNSFDTTQQNIAATFIKNETESGFVKKYEQQGFDAFLYIPNKPIAISKQQYILHSPSAISLPTLGIIENAINNCIRNKALLAKGIDPTSFDSETSDISIENSIDSDTGTKKNFAGVAYGVSFGCGLLIYMMMIIYGTQVMRGVTEEKTNRIAEVIIGSVKPFQLMMGKIVGIGAVGLTQFAVWIILVILMQMAIPVIFPDMMQQIENAGAGQNENMQMLSNTLQGFSSLPMAKIVGSFLFYFLGGYLTYASIFAAVGSVVSEDQQEAQQLVFPVLMPIILGFVMMTKAINEPQSSMAVFGSIFPLTSPIVMMGRITYDVPGWQIALSMGLLVGTFLFFTWITGKVYRTGILMYGKKPSWKEMIKWAFAKG